MIDLSKPTIVVRQPAGLGDILFTQKLVYTLWANYQVIWPVIPQYEWIRDALVTDVQFLTLSPDGSITDTDGSRFMVDGWDTQKIIYNDNLTVVPLHLADRYVPGCMMDAKYKWLGVEYYSDWADFVYIKRRHKRELVLQSYLGELLDVDLLRPYNVVNYTYGSYPNTAECLPAKHATFDDDSIPVISMHHVPTFTLFDWLGIISNAKQFCTVDTSIMYAIEAIPDIQTKLTCYSRYTPPNFANVKHLFKKPWTYVE